VSGIEPVSLALRVPLNALALLALCGRNERWDAARALQVGLVSEVVAPDRLLERAREIASAIAASSPAAVRATRDLIRRFEAGLSVTGCRGDAVQRHRGPDADEGPRLRERRD
jgi:enoyl-CoA hydratase/carnithine racemase